MVSVRTFTIYYKRYGGNFGIDSIFTKEELALLLNEYEKELGPHKTLNIIPEFPKKGVASSLAFIIPASFRERGEVVALHCIATF